MINPDEKLVAAVERAREKVPAYRELLKEAGVSLTAPLSRESLQRLPILEKKNTFQRFPIEQLCIDGQLGKLGSVLTSSGHSGVFAFGLTERAAAPYAGKWIDSLLDQLFSVRSRETLLINCLPMGVRVSTEVCTLAETSVRPDMVVGLVKAFARHYSQTVLIGDAAFIKHVLELGISKGVQWRDYVVHVIVGEETLAENARSYLAALLEPSEPSEPRRILSSMGVAELGLNIFFEAPPHDVLIKLRQLLHRDDAARRIMFGDTTWVPSLFTYDPDRLHVEIDRHGEMLLSTVWLIERLPLIRYRTGDRGAFVSVPAELRSKLEAAGVSWDQLQRTTIIAMPGRGEGVATSGGLILPEQVKEGIYANFDLARLITANFRISAVDGKGLIRIQMNPNEVVGAGLSEKFANEISTYVRAPFEVRCEAYDQFGDGMSLDYERKFSYIAR